MSNASRVHLAGPIRPFALCKSYDAAERHSKDPADVTCPFCSALFLADHPEYVVPATEAIPEPEGRQ